MKFTEAQLEQAFIELLGKEEIPYQLGETIQRSPEEVLIKEDLQEFLMKQYQPDEITVSEVESIIRDLEKFPASDLYESNKAIMEIISNGFLLKREDPAKKDIYIQLVDYKGTNKYSQALTEQNSETEAIAADKDLGYQTISDNNIYKVVNQLEIFGYEKRIPDAIMYINGLPLVVIEFKTAIREDATIHNAFIQLTVRYKRDIPELFKYNALCVISNGVNNKTGSFFAPYEFFYAWRKITGFENEVDGIPSMYSMIQGMFNRNRLRDIIHNFIYLPDSSKKDVKIVCRYPQYYAARKLFENIKKQMRPDGDGKGGIYFGATGCGKSFTMLF